MSESPNFHDVPSELPKIRNMQQTFERRKPNKQLAGNYRNVDCCLAKVEKIRLTQQRVARINNFRCLCEIATSIVWIVFSAESSDFSWETKKSEAFWNCIRNLQSSNLFSIRLRKIFLNLQLVAAFHLFS